MPDVIAWCGFLGAWLLVAGPLDQAVTVKDILNAWLYVAAGASLIAVKETWELHESYEWPEWTFWLGVIGMLALCVGTTFNRARHRRRRPAVD
jgi:hypothetical protein